MEMNKELLAKAKEAKTPEELMTIAKENGTEINEESAKAYFDLLQPKNGELSDEELDNVSGGCNKSDGREIVSGLMYCDSFKCKRCGGTSILKVPALVEVVCKECGKRADCTKCSYCSYEKGLWLCNNDKNRKN